MSQPSAQAVSAEEAARAAFLADVAAAATALNAARRDAVLAIAEQIVAAPVPRMSVTQMAELVRRLSAQSAMAVAGGLNDAEVERFAQDIARGRKRMYRQARRRAVAQILSSRVIDQTRIAAEVVDMAASESVFRVGGVDAAKVPLETQITPLGEGDDVRRRMSVARRRWQRLPYEQYTQRMRSEAARIAGDKVAEQFRATQMRVASAHPDVVGWRRVAHANACLACLAMCDGEVFREPRVFPAHSRCKCSCEAVVRDSPPYVTGQAQWDALSPAEKAERLRGRGGAAKVKALGDKKLSEVVHRPYPGAPVIAEPTLAQLAD